ncbi:MAG TPA: chemotaxis protein CheW [Nitrospirota bacterium]|jgi:purine-binding chemotaxis protein CheW
MASKEISGTTPYLTFHLADEEFALDIAKVREVLDYTTVTKVPNMPNYLRGVINLRGNVVPVIDLRMKLGMTSTINTINTCIVIVEVKMGEAVLHLGALADSVQEVLDLDLKQVEPPPNIGMMVDSEFIQGMGKMGDRFLIILDIDKVISGDHTRIAEVSEAGSAVVAA